jgi:hypothetical protein
MDLNLTNDQMGVFKDTSEPICVRDPQGVVLGILKRYIVDELTPEEIAAAREAKYSPGPRFTTQQVLDHLAQLEAQGK